VEERCQSLCDRLVLRTAIDEDKEDWSAKNEVDVGLDADSSDFGVSLAGFKVAI